MKVLFNTYSKATPIFCTTIEPQKNWVNAAAILVQSLRCNGGTFSASPFVILVNGYSDSPGPLLEDKEQQLLILGNKQHPGIPHLSKVAALSVVNQLPCSHVILLDHDTIILHLDKFSTYLSGEVHARRNYKYSLTRALGQGYTQYLTEPGLKPWSRIHYFNSGVVIVPDAYCQSLKKHWLDWTERLIRPYRGRPLAEQMGLAMALASAQIPYKFLPMHYNETNWKSPSPNAAIIHYNAYDRINKIVKKEILWSFNDFSKFLTQTDNRFWKAHAPAINKLLKPELFALSERIATAIK